MGARSGALAKEFEIKAQEARATLQKLGDADWRKVTEAEKWSVGVTAHHVASTFEVVPDVVRAVTAGRSLDGFELGRIDEINARHAVDHAGCSKAETIELYDKGVAAAAAAIRELSDEDLTKSGTLATGVPPLTAEQIISLGLLNHIDEHFGSIRKTIGAKGEGR